jgi:hypothetical protein
MTGATLVTTPVMSSGRLHTGGRHRKPPTRDKEPARQRVSVANLVSRGAALAVIVTALALVGLMTQRSSQDSAPTVGAGQAPSPLQSAPIPQSPNKTPVAPPLRPSVAPFSADDRGFIDSSARCQGPRPALAIGRTKGSLVVICGDQPGRYEYLGVRLSDAAVMRARAETSSATGFLAQKSGVVYAVSPTELKVTAGSRVIKREPMIEYRQVPR